MKKRILSLALILILCLSICTAALAATRQAGAAILITPGAQYRLADTPHPLKQRTP